MSYKIYKVNCIELMCINIEQCIGFYTGGGGQSIRLGKRRVVVAVLGVVVRVGPARRPMVGRLFRRRSGERVGGRCWVRDGREGPGDESQGGSWGTEGGCPLGGGDDCGGGCF